MVYGSRPMNSELAKLVEVAEEAGTMECGCCHDFEAALKAILPPVLTPPKGYEMQTPTFERRLREIMGGPSDVE